MNPENLPKSTAAATAPMQPEYVDVSIPVSERKGDPDGLNEQRAEWAAASLSTFAQEAGMENEDKQTQLTDLLADLQHLAARDGLDFAQALRMGAQHYEEETAEE